MNLRALQHLAKAAQALADDCQIVVLGSASLLASFPELGSSTGPLASTFDADLCPQPFDENTGKMLEEALGEAQAFHSRHGYHADILRDSGLVQASTVRERLGWLNLPIECQPRLLATFDSVFGPRPAPPSA